MHTDRNLLFGVLALQLDLIRAEQFIEACTIWSAQKNVPLGDVLVERSWILPRDKDLLDSLLERKWAKSNGDARARLAGLSIDLRGSLSALGDEEIQNSLGGANGLASPSLPETRLSASIVQRGRYARRRLHANGGMAERDDDHLAAIEATPQKIVQAVTYDIHYAAISLRRAGLLGRFPIHEPLGDFSPPRTIRGRYELALETYNQVLREFIRLSNRVDDIDRASPVPELTIDARAALHAICER